MSEIYISNQYNELLKISRIDLLGNKDNLLLHSSDGGTFFVSKFLFNFLSSLANSESDSILTPIPSKNLALICQMLNLRAEVQDDITQFPGELELLGLDLRSCKHLVSSLNEQHGKLVKRDPENLEKDNEKEDKVIKTAEPLEDTNVMDQLPLDQPENTQVENKSLNPSTSEDIKVEPFALVAIESSGPNCEGSMEEGDTDEGSVEEGNSDESSVEEGNTDKIENIQEKDADKRSKGTKEKKRRKKSFKYKENPKTTLKLIDGKEELESLECRICGKVYLRKEFTEKGHLALLKLYIAHIHLHKLSVLDCQCDIEFKSTTEKLNHVRMIHKTFVKCDQCNATLKNQESLNKHKEKAHSTKQCHICSYITVRGDQLKTHYMTTHKKKVLEETADKIKPTAEIKCSVEECDKIFLRQGDLNQHYNRVHITRECPICHKILKNKILQQHINTVHNNQKKCCCEKCGKGFIFPALLEQHVAVEHQGVRYKCRYPDCQYKDREYKDKSNRGAHERIKHGVQYTKVSE